MTGPEYGLTACERLTILRVRGAISELGGAAVIPVTCEHVDMAKVVLFINDAIQESSNPDRHLMIIDVPELEGKHVLFHLSIT
jgi:hypothetical protein